MVEISKYVCVAYLGGLAVIDCRRKRLPIWSLMLGCMGAFVSQVFWRKLPWSIVITGTMMGVIFLFVSRITKEAFGYGDSILITMLGIFLGIWDLLILLAIAFFLSSLIAIGALISSHFQRTKTLPFVPFLGCGYVLLLLTGSI